MSLIICINFSFGQNKNLILDSLTKEPVAFASITCNEIGTSFMANERGEWVISDSLAFCVTVTVSCAGYKSKTIRISEVNKVLLSALVVEMPAVEIGSVETEVSVDNIKKLNCSYGFKPDLGSITYASFLPNPTNKHAWLTKLSFHVSTIHKPDMEVPVRIRFFEWDELTNLPGKEISTTNLIIKPQKKHWNTLALEKIKQEVPANGIVIAFELISAGPDHYHKYEYKDVHMGKLQGIYYGWFLSASCCHNCSMIGFSYVNNKWTPWNKVTGLNWAPAVKIKMKYYQ